MSPDRYTHSTNISTVLSNRHGLNQSKLIWGANPAVNPVVNNNSISYSRQNTGLEKPT